MRRLNYDTLNIIVAAQRLRSFRIADGVIREAAGKDAPSWFKSAKSYYSEIPDCVMKVAGLHKNRSDFEKVLNFNVTDETLKTNHNKLFGFEFPADDRDEYRTETGVVTIQS
ncbi:hypothetical protein [Microvirga sesbaniae]|uniref:hypothetical protein n=1 Tax=Microvirga sesbaniae TaxID=681392 RepID=UPI0021C5E9C4|nr:hypothetical protein [Microvirga sp. HBU67692]